MGLRGLREDAKFFPWLLRENVLGISGFGSVTLKLSKGRVTRAGETRGGISKDENLKTPVGSKFLPPVPWV